MRLGLLNSLSDEQIARMQPSFRVGWVERGQQIFAQGEKCQHLRLVQEGSVRLEVERAGEKHLIDVVRAGQVMGEAGVFLGALYPCSGVAAEESLLISIHQTELQRLTDTVPGFGWQLLRLFSARLLANQVRLAALAGSDARERVGAVLLSLAQEVLAEQGAAMAPQTPLQLRVSQREIGQMAGVGRETVSRLLGLWREAGLVQVGRERITLLDVAGLQNDLENGGAFVFEANRRESVPKFEKNRSVL